MAKGDLHLPESLDITEVGSWQQEFIKLSHDYDAITVNDEKLINIDTAGCQLLVAFAMELNSANKSLHWPNPNEVIVRSLKQLGLNNLVFNSNQAVKG